MWEVSLKVVKVSRNIVEKTLVFKMFATEVTFNPISKKKKKAKRKAYSPLIEQQSSVLVIK